MKHKYCFKNSTGILCRKFQNFYFWYKVLRFIRNLKNFIQNQNIIEFTKNNHDIKIKLYCLQAIKKDLEEVIINAEMVKGVNCCFFKFCDGFVLWGMRRQ